MSNNVPEGLKCEVTPEQAYWPYPVPPVPDFADFVDFRMPVNGDDYLEEYGRLATRGDVYPMAVGPRIIVRRKPVKHKFVDGLPGICQQFWCRKPPSDPVHEPAKHEYRADEPLAYPRRTAPCMMEECCQPLGHPVHANAPTCHPFKPDAMRPDKCEVCGVVSDAPIHEQPPSPPPAPAKPRMMQANPACRQGTHSVEHPEQSDCPMHPVCIPVEHQSPVEQPKARRWVVKESVILAGANKGTDGVLDIGKGSVPICVVRKVKPITRAEIDKVCRGTFNYPQVSPAWLSERLRELGIEVEE